MRKRSLFPGGRAGFTLVELLVVIAILGVVAAIIVPSLLASLEKGKQKRTLADQRDTGVAWMSWLSDQVQAAAAGQAASPDWPFDISSPDYPYASLQANLDGSGTLPSGEQPPVYMKYVPSRDGWGNPYIFALNEENLLASHVMAIYSAGRDGDTGNATTSCDDDTAVRPGSHGYFDYRRLDCDLIWKDGFFVQAPAGYQSLTGGPPP